MVGEFICSEIGCFLIKLCRVYLGRHLEKLGEKVAIKIIGKEGNTKVPRKEYKILSRLQHKQIIQLLEVVENDHRVCLVMNYAEGGDLYQHIKKKGKLGTHEAHRIFKQLLTAVAYLHSCGYVHRDIKPENVTPSLKISSLSSHFRTYSGIS